MEKVQGLLKDMDKSFAGLVAILVIGLFLTYGNHFNNGFEFDDFHTIVNNTYIQDISNIPLFFTDNTTMSTNQGNRSYRPIVATLNAIDYWIGGGLDPFWFHVSIFTSYLVLLVFLYLFMKALFDQSREHEWNKYFALFGTAFYAFHTSNAETINYIIARSDSFSTMCVVITMFLYHNAWANKWRLYFIPMIIGIYTKQVGVVVMPILLVYIIYYEFNVSLRDIFLLRKKKELLQIFRVILPIAIIGTCLFFLNQFIMTRGASANLLAPSRVSRFDYFSTQWYVIAHYIGNFILPINLSADPDIKIIRELFDARKILGLIIIVWMLYVAFRTSDRKETRPISFGILWFFISLAPTSTFHTLNQISNDHRVFLPYIGLVIAVTWYVCQLILKWKEKWDNQVAIKTISLSLAFLIIAGHAYGTRQRNIVWSSSESLWYDVTIKSPTNGRGLMNYALHLMQRGEYEETLVYFEKALEYLPYYSYLHINMGILKNAMGEKEEAGKYFVNALRYDRGNPEAYNYYARFLLENGNTQEAADWVRKGLERSPGHLGLQRMLERVQNAALTPEEKLARTIEKVKAKPTVENLLNLSLQFYNLKQYQLCLDACENVLKLDPQNAAAYNNMCIAYIRLGEQEKAIQACEKSLSIKPDFSLAKNNLNWAKSLK